MRRRFGRFLRTCELLLLAAFLLVGGRHSAFATTELYTIDPVQSTISVQPATQLRIDFFGLITSVDLPITSQVGAGGTPGTLPDGSTSDGLRAALTGQLLVDVQGGSPTNPNRLQILARRTSLRLEDSGTWLPGLPATRAQAAPGALALRFDEPSFGLTGSVSLRDLELSVSHSFSQPLGPAGGGLFRFSLGAASLNPLPVDGVLDFETSLPGSSQAGRAALLPSFSASVLLDSAGEGQLLQQPGGGRQITLPLAATVFLDDQTFVAGIPWGMTLELSGQLVATNASFVPEPSALGVLAAALLQLVSLRRSRGQRS